MDEARREAGVLEEESMRLVKSKESGGGGVEYIKVWFAYFHSNKSKYNLQQLYVNNLDEVVFDRRLII